MFKSKYTLGKSINHLSDKSKVDNAAGNNLENASNKPISTTMSICANQTSYLYFFYNSFLCNLHSLCSFYLQLVMFVFQCSCNPCLSWLACKRSNCRCVEWMSLERCHSKTANTFNYCAHDIETGKGKRRRKTKTPPKKKLVQTDRRTRSSDRRPLSSPNASENSCSDCSKTCKCASRSSTVRCNIAIRALKKHDWLTSWWVRKRVLIIGVTYAPLFSQHKTSAGPVIWQDGTREPLLRVQPRDPPLPEKFLWKHKDPFFLDGMLLFIDMGRIKINRD